jgi:hypothetical protein
MPAMMPVRTVMTTDRSRTPGSIERSKNESVAAERYTSTPRRAKVVQMPSAPPAIASSTDSVSSARTMRPRLAPSDARIAISCSRAVHCAIIRIATFAQAMSSVSSTDVARTYGRTMDTLSPIGVPSMPETLRCNWRSSVGSRLAYAVKPLCSRAASNSGVVPSGRRTTT